jgi:hypothetical protein
MSKFAEFILTTFKGRLVLFAIIAATLLLYTNVAKASENNRCLIIGDSIAVGTKMFAPKECVSYSRGGWNTWQWNRRWGNIPLEARTVVISLGTNDHSGVNTFRELSKVRSRIRSTKVVWIMPPCNKSFCKPNVNAIVRDIATKHGDRIITTQHLQPDDIHPSSRGYRELVQKARL